MHQLTPTPKHDSDNEFSSLYLSHFGMMCKNSSKSYEKRKPVLYVSHYVKLKAYAIQCDLRLKKKEDNFQIKNCDIQLLFFCSKHIIYILFRTISLRQF